MTSQVMKYKDQIGSVEFDFDDNCLHGQLLHISDLVTYEAETVEGLKREFEAAVDDYLETCEQLGVEANKPFKGSFNIRIGPELHKKIAFKASELSISVNDAVTRAVSDFVAESPSSSELLNDVHDHLKQYVYEYQSKFFDRRSNLAHIIPHREPSFPRHMAQSKGSKIIFHVEHANEH
tara:strand:+ start:4904 stop:5440 length:537 start_codon:yes stop_codon:yes gene_type:complete